MSQKFVEQLKEILGPNGWLEGEDTESYLTDMFGKQGETPLVARPDTTEQVSEVVKICAANNVANNSPGRKHQCLPYGYSPGKQIGSYPVDGAYEQNYRH